MLMQRKKTRMEEYMERRNKDKRFAAEAQEKKEEKPKKLPLEKSKSPIFLQKQ